MLVAWVILGSLEVVAALSIAALDFSNRLNRVFSLALILFGARLLARVLSRWTADSVAWFGLSAAMDTAAPFVLLYFAFAYRERFSAKGGRRLAFWAILGMGTVDVLASVLGGGRDALAGSETGSLFDDLNLWLFTFGFAAVSALLARDALAAEAPARRRALLTASLGFGFLPMAFAPHFLIPGLMSGVGPREAIVVASALVPLAYVVLRVAKVARTGDERAAAARRFLATLALPWVSVVALALLFFARGPDDVTQATMLLLMTAWQLCLVVLVGYAILKQQLFSLDSQLKWTLDRGTVAAVFLAVFFTVSQVAQNFLSASLGWAAGGLAAGLLLFALTPLQNFAHRLADAALPGVRAPSELAGAERAHVYREQARAAWSDGMISREERKLLETARAALGLTHEEAARIELEVADATATP